VPLYFFNIDGEAPDDVGVECETLAHAKCAASELAGQIMCDESEAFWKSQEWGMTVTNEVGLALFTMSFYAQETAATSHRVSPMESVPPHCPSP
jgi:hypothetical protein